MLAYYSNYENHITTVYRQFTIISILYKYTCLTIFLFDDFFKCRELYSSAWFYYWCHNKIFRCINCETHRKTKWNNHFIVFRACECILWFWKSVNMNLYNSRVDLEYHWYFSQSYATSLTCECSTSINIRVCAAGVSNSSIFNFSLVHIKSGKRIYEFPCLTAYHFAMISFPIIHVEL